MLFKGQDRPSLKQLLKLLKPEISGVAAQWYDLGVQLLDNATGILDVIRADNPNGANKCCTIMFEKWLKLKPDATWNQLVTALKTVGLNSSADNLTLQLTGGNNIVELIKSRVHNKGRVSNA